MRGPRRPPSRFLPYSRNSPANLLVLGGTAAQRLEVAREHHALGSASGLAFEALDCASEEARLRGALERWVLHGRSSAESEIRGENPGGVLFLDSIGAIGAPTQRLLLLFASRLQAQLPGAPIGAGPARLAAGDAGELLVAVARQRFSSALFDCLDKIRVELTHAARSGAA
ncbi:MAG TPA: hypothetical protein VMH61_03545 [Candidatus Acidoferrales bacterium]|nr:hypothetical protein [Candidatus Acidoferrales bacterium]